MDVVGDAADGIGADSIPGGSVRTGGREWREISPDRVGSSESRVVDIITVIY